MFFVGYIFSEMASQKWIVLCAFLSLFTFMAKVRSSPTCLEEVIQQLEETLIALENVTYSGKSPSCPVKRRRDELRFHKVSHRKGLLDLDTRVIHTQAGQHHASTFTSDPEHYHFLFEFSLTFKE